MAKAQFTYAVGLVSDDGGKIYKPTFNNALALLKDFLVAHDGEYLGPFRQDFEEHPNYAVVKMDRKAEDALQDLNAELHKKDGKQPFVERLEGLVFNVSEAKGMTIHPDPYMKRLAMGMPV